MLSALWQSSGEGRVEMGQAGAFVKEGALESRLQVGQGHAGGKGPS
jgi:hypothetical protein